MTGYSQQNRKVEMGRGEVRGGGAKRKGASVNDHVGDGTWTITFAP